MCAILVCLFAVMRVGMLSGDQVVGVLTGKNWMWLTRGGLEIRVALGDFYACPLMRVICWKETDMRNLKLSFNLIASGVVLALALLFCIYPAVIVGVLLTDAKLKHEGQSRLVPLWFRSVAGRYQSWASEYLESGCA